MKKPPESTAQRPITEIGVFANGPIPQKISDVIGTVRSFIKFFQWCGIVKQLPELPVHSLKAPPEKIDMGIGMKVPHHESWDKIHASIRGTMRAIGFAIAGVFLAGGALGYCARASCDSRRVKRELPSPNLYVSYSKFTER